MNAHELQQRILCLRAAWKLMAFKSKSFKTQQFSTTYTNNNFSNLQGRSQRSKASIFLFAGGLLSHNLSKFCKLSYKFAQISLRATRFFPAQAIGGKMGAQWSVGWQMEKTKINLEKIPQCSGPQTWCAYQETPNSESLSLFKLLFMGKNLKFQVGNIPLNVQCNYATPFLIYCRAPGAHRLMTSCRHLNLWDTLALKRWLVSLLCRFLSFYVIFNEKNLKHK